ncbi:MAG TPA: GNAT family N-acetyltransferase [Hymenobacter sp.]|jgi:ribosomal-protein-alanine N-acetyltransferase|uniref:GNAT family N-acetyltransferase n=1 Tax=Hymenobacter sp. TaxID=1898978 RepID=UPI002EDB2B2E
MLTFDFTPFPVLTTERLQLRQLTLADAPAMFVMRADPQVMQYIPSLLFSTLEDANKHIDMVNGLVSENKALNWGITLRDSPEVLGTIGYYRVQPENFRAEIGYLLHPVHQGKGLMQEAITKVLKFGFQKLGLHSVEGVVDPRNTASARVLERAGFVQEGYFRENGFWNGEFIDSAVYSLLHPASR